MFVGADGHGPPRNDMINGNASRIVTVVQHPPFRPMPTATPPERLFYSFLEATPDAVVIIDEGGIIVHVNSQTEKLFGYGRVELIGRALEVLMPERFRGVHVAHRGAYLAEPRSRSMGRGLDLFGERKDGTEFPIDVSISRLPLESGGLFASAIRDMSDHWRREEELRARSRELEEADLQKDHFLAAVAHELRNPLSAMANATELLRSAHDDAAAQRVAGVIERQTAHMARLVEDLLDLARVRRGNVTLQRESIDLRRVVTSAVEVTHSIIKARKHELEVAPLAEPLWVSGDRTRLMQVVANLLSNAAKYTPNGGHINLTTTREDGAAVVRVRDSGAGIPHDMLSRVFELFTQIKGDGEDRSGGLGIGLSLVRKLVDLHGGTVTAFSKGLGRGSEFVVRLPLLPEPLYGGERSS